MKKCFVILTSLVSVFLLSCKEKSVIASAAAESNSLPVATMSENGDMVFDAGNFFTPDYTPCELEPENVAGTVRLTSPKSNGGKSQSSIPAERALSDYKIAYNSKKSAFTYPEIKKMEATPQNSEPFTISDWGPQGTIPSEVKFPSFYVLFSEPVVSLSALGQECDARDYVTIEPEIQGIYRWNGTSLLSFDTTESVNPMQVYTIKVNESVKSLSGKTLEGKKSFSTKAAPLKIIWSAPGYSKNKYVDRNEVPPAFSKEFRVQFNYPVQADEIKKISEISVNYQKIPFTVKQEMIDTLTYEWTEDIPFDAHVTLTVIQGNLFANSTEGQKSTTTASFHTLTPFIYEYETESPTYGKYTNPVRLYFSHPVAAASVLSGITAKNDKGEKMPFTKENFEVSGSSVRIYALPVSFHSKYTLEIAPTLQDIYNRKLSTINNEVIELEIEVPGAESKVQFTDSGTKMLESQFPHKLVFEYQNIDEGAYTLNTTLTPFSLSRQAKISDYVFAPENESIRTTLSTEPRDERIFEVVNLDDKLLGKAGWVNFYSAIKLPKAPSKWDSSTFYWRTNATSIQVTNLGVTVRYGMNRIVAMVTRLSDGTPVEGANVWACKYEETQLQSPESIKQSSPYARTDKNGMAVIALTKWNRKNVISGKYWDSPLVYVEKDDDKLLYRPDDHSPWRNGVYSYASVPSEITAEPRIFMFSDRGLYKPGETVSFRGIDRDQVLGSFIPYEGDYSVVLKEDSWRNAKEFGTSEGKTSESGGFYGSFKIPEDIQTGIYKLQYKRSDGKSKEITINVAFFERLKFQSSLSMPQTPVIAGEKIQANLNASYLAGGALASAKYEANWFREPWYFTSDAAEFNQYTFGPADRSESRNHISESEGALDANGGALISCQTGAASIKGAPYRYRVSADVTDVSNQQISSVGITVVHPASFYVGLSKPQMQSSFAKKGEKLTFTYKLALPDGTAVSDAKTLSSVAGKAKRATVTLSREEWNIVQQQGIDDIYSRYEKSDVTESKDEVTLQESGKITVTPQEPGYHKIQIATSDKNGRDVITEYEFFVTGSGRISWYQDDATSLRLTPDKNQYLPGETAHILLESTLPKGNYLITVEREGIFTEEVRSFDTPIQVIDIPVARNYVPVFYVSVSSYSVRQGYPKHEYGTPDIDKPKGFYGATTLFVNPRIKAFSVAIENTKPSYRPGEEAEVTLVATKGGKPLANAELTLLAVDRGVLDLINYHIPDPLDFFYNISNFPLRVKGGDSRAYLMDPVTYEVKNLMGGDSDENEKINERSDFNPTAVFEPMLKTDENGRVTAKFKLPDTLTTYRITVFGVNGELLALQEDEIAVQNPINVQQVLPRQLRERDTAELGVLLTNLDEKAHDITVSLAIRESNGEQEENGITAKDGAAFIDGKAAHTVKVASGANSVVYFELAAQKAGAITLEFTITSDILNERLVTPLKIEKPYIFETVTTIGQLGESEDSAQERIVIPSFTEDMNGSLSVTLDATRLGLLGGAVQYLFEYPYGCMEQQSARVLPLVIFEDYIDVFNLESRVTNIHSCVSSYFKEWKKCQHTDGGFGYWPSSHYSNLFVSTRIAHIYALARERGYKDTDLAIDIEKLISYIESAANSAKNSISDYEKAYIYYALALNGRTISETKLKLLIIEDKQDTEILALAALASIKNVGPSSPIAKEAARKIRSYLKPTARGVDITNPLAPHHFFAYYGDSAENLALTLQLFTLLNKDDEMNTRLIFSLLQNQRAGYWKNTATTARVLEAIYTVIKENNLDKTKLNASVLLAGTEFANGSFSGAGAKPVTITVPFTDAKINQLEKNAELPLSFNKKGTGSLYYTTTMKYAIPEELQNVCDAGLGLTMKLYDNATGAEITIDNENPFIELENGKTYKVILTLSSSYDRSFVALRAPVPSGAEILDATFVTSPDTASSASGRSRYSKDYDDYTGYFYGGDHYMSNQAIYNSEIQFFYDSFGKGKTTAEFKFRAVRRGVYPTPPATAECMYEDEIYGRTSGILYKIK